MSALQFLSGDWQSHVKLIDLSASKSLLLADDVIKMAFGSSPPTIETWEIRYMQQPRFAPELSFVA